nr:hypothetical protein [uncultured Pseudodesulfovibrio sp.]
MIAVIAAASLTALLAGFTLLRMVDPRSPNADMLIQTYKACLHDETAQHQ